MTILWSEKSKKNRHWSFKTDTLIDWIFINKTMKRLIERGFPRYIGQNNFVIFLLEGESCNYWGKLLDFFF